MFDFNTIGVNGFETTDTNVPLLCDKNTTTVYKLSQMPASLFFNPKKPHVVSKMQINGGGSYARTMTPQLYGSNDGINFTLLYTGAYFSSFEGNYVYNLPAGLPAFKHFRLDLNATAYDRDAVEFRNVILTGEMQAVKKFLVKQGDTIKTFISGSWENLQ
ncbi:hypothetical protein C0431_12510 [bacterium]|nr:hypothetical protein [bacterium]